MAKIRSTIPLECLEQFKKLASKLDLEVKGATMPYLSLNGNMFAFLSSEGALHLRLPSELLTQIISEGLATQSIQHGAVLKEYATIQESLWLKAKKLNSLMQASYAYAQTLKPKSSKKRS